MALSGSPAVLGPAPFRPMTLRPPLSRGLPFTDQDLRGNPTRTPQFVHWTKVQSNEKTRGRLLPQWISATRPEPLIVGLFFVRHETISGNNKPAEAGLYAKKKRLFFPPAGQADACQAQSQKRQRSRFRNFLGRGGIVTKGETAIRATGSAVSRSSEALQVGSKLTETRLVGQSLRRIRE